MNVPTHSLPSRRRARRTVTGLLSLTLASAATPSALADPAAPADQ
ncbi:hydrolase, partial [Corynebacterium bovis]